VTCLTAVSHMHPDTPDRETAGSADAVYRVRPARWASSIFL